MLTKERKKNERRKYFAVHFIAFLFSSQFLFLSCFFFLLFFLSFLPSYPFLLPVIFFFVCSSCLYLCFALSFLVFLFSFLLFYSSFSVPPFSVPLFSVPPFLFLLFFLSLLFLFLFFLFLLLSFFRRVRSTAKVPYLQRQASSQILCPLSQSTISVRNLTRHASLCLLHCRLLCKL